METTFTFRNMDTTEALRNHTLDKLDKLTKYLVKPGNAHIIFNVEKFNHVAEITLTANGQRYVGIERSNDMYLSIDGAIRKLEDQLRKYKERLKAHKGEAG
jgi:putative sigma-54 modulation protein